MAVIAAFLVRVRAAIVGELMAAVSSADLARVQIPRVAVAAVPAEAAGTAAVAMAAVTAATTVAVNWGHGHGGWYGYPYYGYGFGYGFYDPFWPYPYYYPYGNYGYSYSYYPPPVVETEPVLPPEDYLDAPVDGGNRQEQVWYYCEDPAGYYPYVRSCNGPWQAVPATPPGDVQQGGLSGEGTAAVGQAQQVGPQPGN